MANFVFSRIAIVGAGAIGGYYGARLALAGNDVRFLVRDAAPLRAHGLTLRERDATRRVEHPAVFSHAAEEPTAGLIGVLGSQS